MSLRRVLGMLSDSQVSEQYLATMQPPQIVALPLPTAKRGQHQLPAATSEKRERENALPFPQLEHLLVCPSFPHLRRSSCRRCKAGCD